MPQLSPSLLSRVTALARDRVSGASAIRESAIGILREALSLGQAGAAAAALCRAQPSMASVWNASLHALATRDEPERFERFARSIERAPQALVRFGLTLFEPGTLPLDIVTLSASGSVVLLIDGLRQRGPLRVSCSEARPAFEGRQLAARLAARGVEVTFFTDAALAHALDAADAVLVGADAVGPGDFVNKTGTRALVAAAGAAGVPAYVAATRDKFVMPALWRRLTIRDEPADEVWDTPPANVLVRNPYFEIVPLDLVSGVISDLGVLSFDMVGEVCASLEETRLLAALDELPGGP